MTDMHIITDITNTDINIPALQHTVEKPVSCVGVGLHSGAETHLTIRPGAENSGIVFKRKDVQGFNPYVRASYEHVSNTNLGTTLSNEDGTLISTVEHLMAAFWGCGVDNAVVEVDGPEVPIMDGSSEPFVFLIECAGLKTQSRPRKVIEVLKRIEIREQDKFVYVEPAENFSVSLEIDFESQAISRQTGEFHGEPVSFKKDLSRARTFGFEHEVSWLRSRGLARGGSLANAVVVSGNKVLNKEGLRYGDEFVRHKILDCIGDFYLTGGAFIQGKFSGYRSGHGLNNQLLRHIFSDGSAWKMKAAA